MNSFHYLNGLEFRVQSVDQTNTSDGGLHTVGVGRHNSTQAFNQLVNIGAAYVRLCDYFGGQLIQIRGAAQRGRGLAEERAGAFASNVPYFLGRKFLRFQLPLDRKSTRLNSSHLGIS